MSEQQLAAPLVAPQQPQRLSALNAMAARFQVEPAKLLDTLKQTVFKGATDAQMMALCIVANEWGLSPFTKEIYAFPDSKSGGIIPVIGVDGWLNRINAHPQFDGLDQEFEKGADGKPYSCTVTIYRKDRSRPMKHVELFAECFRKTDPWQNQPHRMLGHRAVIQCARKAFGFSGADPEDAQRMQEVQANGRVIEPVAPARPQLFSPPAAAAESAASGERADGDDVAGTGEEVGSGKTEDGSGGEAPKRGGWPKGRPRKVAAPEAPEPPDAIPFRLSDEEEAARNTKARELKRKVRDAGIEEEAFDLVLSRNSFPPLSMLADSEAAEVLENFDEMLRMAKEEAEV